MTAIAAGSASPCGGTTQAEGAAYAALSAVTGLANRRDACISPAIFRRCIAIKRLFKDKSGEGYVDVAIAMLIIFALIAGIFSLFPIYTTYQSLNATALQMAHVIEVCGQADSATLALVTSNDRLLKPDTTGIDTTWYNAYQKKIQLKTPFTVTLTKQMLIPILKPVGGNAIGIRIIISASASGISEVYWKG